MAKKNKTEETDVNVEEFIHTYVSDEQKKADSFELIRMMRKWSGAPPKMWGPTIIGFGSYHYKYASGHEGDAALMGFSPRKAEFSLYVYCETKENDELLGKLGKFKMGKACIYVKRLADIDTDILEKIALNSMKHTISLYGRKDT